MTDIVDQATRSRMMSRIRNRDTTPEIAVRRELYRLGIRYRLHNGKLPGQPDIVISRLRTVIGSPEMRMIIKTISYDKNLIKYLP